MFPVDVSTASRATIGGMTGNNSCGARSIRYGTMRDNVLAINAISATGQRGFFGDLEPKGAVDDLTRALLDVGRTHAAEIDERFPKVQRRVGGYNIDALVQSRLGASIFRICLWVPRAPWPSLSRSISSFHRCRVTRHCAYAISQVSTRRWTHHSIWSSLTPARLNWWIGP